MTRRSLNPAAWHPVAQIGAACALIGTVAGAISAVSPVYTAADPLQLANHQFVNEQVTAGAKQVIDALVPRLDAMQVTITSRGDAIAEIGPRLDALQATVETLQNDVRAASDEGLRTRITATRTSILQLTGQLNDLNAPLADYPHNVALLQQRDDIQRQLDAMRIALAAATCELNRRITPGFVCPGN